MKGSVGFGGGTESEIFPDKCSAQITSCTSSEGYIEGMKIYEKIKVKKHY